MFCFDGVLVEPEALGPIAGNPLFIRVSSHLKSNAHRIGALVVKYMIIN